MIVLNLQINMERTDIFAVLPSFVHEISLHLFKFSLISFIRVLKIYSCMSHSYFLDLCVNMWYRDINANSVMLLITDANYLCYRKIHDFCKLIMYPTVSVCFWQHCDCWVDMHVLNASNNYIYLNNIYTYN
jgi:hypothetical protein